VPRVLPPPHQARNLVGFFQAVHSAAQAVLVAVLARTELAVAPDSQPAQRFSAQQTGFCTHFRPKYKKM
jgi:hypothetical protein